MTFQSSSNCTPFYIFKFQKSSIWSYAIAPKQTAKLHILLFDSMLLEHT